MATVPSGLRLRLSPTGSASTSAVGTLPKTPPPSPRSISAPDLGPAALSAGKLGHVIQAPMANLRQQLAKLEPGALHIQRLPSGADINKLFDLAKNNGCNAVLLGANEHGCLVLPQKGTDPTAMTKVVFQKVGGILGEPQGLLAAGSNQGLLLAHMAGVGQNPVAKLQHPPTNQG